VAFDLKTFFAVVGKDPVEVTAVDVFDFLAHQRGDRSVVRLADRESGLSARTIARVRTGPVKDARDRLPRWCGSAATAATCCSPR
jgi:hypothetical protein